MKTTLTHQISEDGSSEWESPVLIPENEIEQALVRSFILAEMPKEITALGPWVGDKNPTAKPLSLFCSISEKVAPDGWLSIYYGPLPIRARAFGNEHGTHKVKVEWELVADFERHGLRALKQGNHAPYAPVVGVADPIKADAATDPLSLLD